MSIVQQAFVSPKSIRFVLNGAVVCLFLTNLSLEHNFWSKKICTCDVKNKAHPKHLCRKYLNLTLHDLTLSETLED